MEIVVNKIQCTDSAPSGGSISLASTTFKVTCSFTTWLSFREGVKVTCVDFTSSIASLHLALGSCGMFFSFLCGTERVIFPSYGVVCAKCSLNLNGLSLVPTFLSALQ